MSFTDIFLGTTANDGTGDTLREGGNIINENFDKAVDKTDLERGSIYTGTDSNEVGILPVSDYGYLLSCDATGWTAATITDNGGFAQYNFTEHNFEIGDTVFGSGFVVNDYNVSQEVTAKDTTSITTDVAYVSDDTGNIVNIKGLRWVAPYTDPMTTRGDIIYRNDSNESARLPISTTPKSVIGTTDGIDVSYFQLVSDDAYNATTWDGDTDAATKNALRDKIVSMDSNIALGVTAYGWAPLVSAAYTHAIGNGNDHSSVAANNTFRATPSTVITAGTNLSWSGNTLNATGGGAVDSVNGQTGVVVLDQDDIGDGTTYKQYSSTEKTKLAGIETGAEVNVQSDWNQTTTSSDDYIKNKPDALPKITVSDESSDTTCFMVFVNSATGEVVAHTGSNALFNSATGEFKVTTLKATGDVVAYAT